MDFNINFRNEFQEEGFWLKHRNQCLSGGFNNGKTYNMCQKAIFLGLSFPNYRTVIARQFYKDLKATTMQTFFNVLGPNRDKIVLAHDNQAGITVFRNRSLFYWMHLDAFDEQSLRGLEINSAFVDQAEEMQEAIYLVLDSRIGRWSKAEVPSYLLNQYPNWPKNKYGELRVPNYHVLGCNPDSQFHFIYKRYHPDSLEKLPNHIMIQAQTDESLGDPETMEQMKGRDETWVKKYFRGEWGISEAQIHFVPSASLLDPSECERVGLFKKIQERARLYRVIDHGDSSPTSCGWFAALENYHIMFREYYMPNTVISQHRQNIFDLSIGEQYSGNYADPQIFKKTAQKDGGFWSVADEYGTKSIQGPPLYWNPADNNEFATRNRINELFRLDHAIRHPITGISPAPRFYLIKKTCEYQNGVFHGITETQAQRRKLLTSINGKSIYSDDREESVADHSYDTIRYYVAIHGQAKAASPRIVHRNSFAWYNRLTARQKKEVLAASGAVQ